LNFNPTTVIPKELIINDNSIFYVTQGEKYGYSDTIIDKFVTRAKEITSAAKWVMDQVNVYKRFTVSTNNG
jgi:hypothetical protein